MRRHRRRDRTAASTRAAWSPSPSVIFVDRQRRSLRHDGRPARPGRASATPHTGARCRPTRRPARATRDPAGSFVDAANLDFQQTPGSSSTVNNGRQPDGADGRHRGPPAHDRRGHRHRRLRAADRRRTPRPAPPARSPVRSTSAGRFVRGAGRLHDHERRTVVLTGDLGLSPGTSLTGFGLHATQRGQARGRPRRPGKDRPDGRYNAAAARRSDGQRPDGHGPRQRPTSTSGTYYTSRPLSSPERVTLDAQGDPTPGSVPDRLDADDRTGRRSPSSTAPPRATSTGRSAPVPRSTRPTRSRATSWRSRRSR